MIQQFMTERVRKVQAEFDRINKEYDERLSAVQAISSLDDVKQCLSQIIEREKQSMILSQASTMLLCEISQEIRGA